MWRIFQGEAVVRGSQGWEAWGAETWVTALLFIPYVGKEIVVLNENPHQAKQARTRDRKQSLTLWFKAIADCCWRPASAFTSMPGWSVEWEGKKQLCDGVEAKTLQFLLFSLTSWCMGSEYLLGPSSNSLPWRTHGWVAARACIEVSSGSL